MFTFTKMIAEAQDDLMDSGDQDFDERHYIKACGKWAACGALDGIIIAGTVMVVMLAAIGVGTKIKK